MIQVDKTLSTTDITHFLYTGTSSDDVEKTIRKLLLAQHFKDANTSLYSFYPARDIKPLSTWEFLKYSFYKTLHEQKIDSPQFWTKTAMAVGIIALSVCIGYATAAYITAKYAEAKIIAAAKTYHIVYKQSGMFVRYATVWDLLETPIGVGMFVYMALIPIALAFASKLISKATPKSYKVTLPAPQKLEHKFDETITDPVTTDDLEGRVASSSKFIPITNNTATHIASFVKTLLKKGAFTKKAIHNPFLPGVAFSDEQKETLFHQICTTLAIDPYKSYEFDGSPILTRQEYIEIHQKAKEFLQLNNVAWYMNDNAEKCFARLSFELGFISRISRISWTNDDWKHYYIQQEIEQPSQTEIAQAQDLKEICDKYETNFDNLKNDKFYQKRMKGLLSLNTFPEEFVTILNEN